MPAKKAVEATVYKTPNFIKESFMISDSVIEILL